MKDPHRAKIKDNSRKTGWAQDHKNKKRAEAEERNKKYQALSLKDKLERNSERVKFKLTGS